ncbi:hypothetical protein E2F43_17720 [Seongchinamella unica]|uniref:Big-1 domain-containing protein n=1 Tax=Seongchinamella unica TaxID=2547392 RepID=A0A4R5LP86_9GAMM|nr:Ig-like domain-containing protein [Seongchinamella unica]TDG12183.1 hypothetical protein E2F43_17720 [Seongchinamella unica]
MTNRFATFSSRMAVALTMILAIAACGGGGGGGGGFKGDGGSGGDADTDTYFIQLALRNSQGEESSIVTANEPGTLQVLVTEKNANGRPVPSVIVTASTSSGLLDPSSGNGLTNAEGAVTFTVRAGQDRGAGTITVSVEDPQGAVVERSVNFQIGVGDLRLGHLQGSTYFDAEIGIAPDGPIAAKGEAILSLAIVDRNGLPIGTAESINISSLCLDIGDANLSPANPIPVVAGRVEVTYTADGCQGLDQLTAEVIGVGAQAFGTIEISDTVANGLTFVSAVPNLIVLKGTGGGPTRQEKSEVTFQAVDSNAQPLEGVDIAFSLTTDVGGLSFSPKSGTTAEDGTVSTVVSSGDVATVVRVVATADAGELGEVSAVSDVLTVSTGLPDQNSISLSVDGNFVVEEGMTKDGVTRTLTVRMADKFNNPVPDGTAAVFTTEYGAIQPSCETVGGQCSVVWNSQAPRIPTLNENQDLVVTINDPGYSCPSHNGSSGPCPDDLGMIRGGRSTILVTAIGEESFIDSNANGIYDRGERFANLSEAFLDINENGFYDQATTSCNNSPNSLTCKAGSEEIFTDFNSNGVFDANGDDELNGYPDEGVEAMYNGLLCPKEGDGVYCSRQLLNVNDSAVLILSTDPNWDIALYRGRTPASSTSYNGGTYTAYVSDLFNSKPTGGSTVNIEASGSCEITGKDSFEVPNTTAPGAFAISFSQSGVGDEAGEVTITLSPSDGGPDYSESWPCTPEPEPVDPEPCDPNVELCPGG